MVSFDDICKRIFADSQWARNVLIGGVLSFVPILNIFALGYLYRYFGQIRRGGGFAMPNWEDWEGMFKDGLYMLAVIALYGLLPVFGVWLALHLFGLVSTHQYPFMINGSPLVVSVPQGFSLFDGAGSIILVPITFLTPLWVMAMLFLFQSKRSWPVLARPALAWLMTRAAWPAFALPALAFWGLIWLGQVLYGFAFFLGFLVLGAYYTRLFMEIQNRGPSRPMRG